jgi:GTP cyclohydrolase I
VENFYKELLKSTGENIKRQGLKNTPKRAAEAFRYLTKGYSQNIKSVINGAIFDSDTDEMIVVKDIEMYSPCEHHLLPFFGKCHVGYIPKGKILGLSKIARIVDFYGRRLQVQENLTRQIAETIMKYTNCSGVGVVV